MFTASIKSAPDFKKVILTDTLSGTTAEIIPSCGAILHAFTILHNGKTINVIDSYENEADFKTNAEAKGFKSNKLSPFACRIKNAGYNFNNKAYTIQKFLLGSNAIHGLLYNVNFTVKQTWANDTGAGVALLYSYNGSDAGYPFNYNCEVVYELKTNNALTLTTTVTNTHHSPIPMQDGWHPYFTFGGSINNLQLQFNSDKIVEFDETLIPTGKFLPYSIFNTLKKIDDTFFDNCFTLQPGKQNPACVLKDVAQQLQLEIYPDAAYPYLQIYTPPHRNSIAIENLSAIPDAFNNGTGLIILPPLGTAQFATTYKISLL